MARAAAFRVKEWCRKLPPIVAAAAATESRRVEAKAPRRRPITAIKPTLDGLRALRGRQRDAHHASQSWAVGGFLGVDAFFVLSGFLITTLLVTEWGARGRIDLKAFWVRRARRLLPALFFVMIGIVFLRRSSPRPDEVEKIRSDGFATLGYVANWRFIFAGQSYFDQFSAPSPFRHMWSLAIEEQF